MEVPSDFKTRASTSAAFLPLLTWSSISDHSRRTTLVPTCSINRYYDPTTDSFISVDPDLQSTVQAYVFTNDNPLNATDPSGLFCVGFNDAICPSAGLRVGQTPTSIPGDGLPTVSLSTPPLTFQTGLGFSVTVNASATVTIVGGRQNMPTLNVDSSGAVGVTAGGATIGAAPGRYGTALFGFASGSLPFGTHTYTVGGDSVTVAVTYTVSGGYFDSPGFDAYVAGSGIAVGASGAAAWWISKLACVGLGPAAGPVCTVLL